MTRNAFLHLKFLVIPYCEFHRGPSTQFNESFHVEINNITFNFYWCIDETVSVGSYNSNEQNPWKQNKSIISREKMSHNKFQVIINNILNEVNEESIC